MAIEPPQKRNIAEIMKFTRISDTLASAGQPTMAQLAAVRDVGFYAVINLLPPDRIDPAEEAVVRELGMEYVSIPVVWATPQISDVQQFFKAMERFEGRRVFVHCAVNMRASAFVYLYRIARLGVDPDEAEIDLHDIWVPSGVWAELMETILAYN